MKIVLVINAIIDQREKITNIIDISNEFYFLYDNKYKWSVKKERDDFSDNYFINFYPDKQGESKLTIDEVASNRKWGLEVSYVTYSSKELNTIEALDTFKDLYDLLFNEVYGIDDVFDNIIGDDFD